MKKTSTRITTKIKNTANISGQRIVEPLMKLCQLLLTIIIIFPPQSWAKILPLDDFIKHGDYLDVKISPDGKHLAARYRDKNEVVVLFIRTEDKKVVGGITPNNRDELHSVTWVSNERVVFQLAEKRYYLDTPVPTGELYAVNIDNTRSEMIYGYRASDKYTGSRISRKDNSMASHEILSILEGDDKNILIIEYPWSVVGNYWYNNRSRASIISKLNVFTGRKKRVEMLPHKGAQALAGKDGDINFISWGDEASKFHSAFRKNKQSPWQEIKTVFSFQETPYPVAINDSNEKVYLLADTGERKLSTLFELKIHTGEINPLFSDVESDLEEWTIDKNTQLPVIGKSYPGKPQHHYLKMDNALIKTHKKLAKAFKGKDISIASQTQDGSVLVLHVSSDINPGEYYLYNTQTNKADFLWANRSWIDPREMLAKQAITLKARDGVALNGYLTLPASIAQDKPPLLVIPHGGPHGVRDYWGYDSETQLLANRGYAVLQVNFRGSGGYGEIFTKKGYHQWGGQMISDIIDATQWTVDQGHVDYSGASPFPYDNVYIICNVIRSRQARTAPLTGRSGEFGGDKWRKV